MVTLIVVAPVACIPVIQLICDESINVALLQLLPPIVTFIVPVAKFVPVIVTVVPPYWGPDVGDMDAIVGAGFVMYVKPLLNVVEPPAVVTITLFVPAVPVGVVQVKVVDEFTVMLLQLLPSMVTFVAPVIKLVPVIVTIVPPPVIPVVGDMDAIVGAAMYVKPLLNVDEPPAVDTVTFF